jgi:hypothetical protein
VSMHDVLPKKVVSEAMAVVFLVFRIGHSRLFLARSGSFFPRQ